MSGTARSMTGVQARSLASVGGSEEETDIRGVVLESEDERQTKIFSFISATDDFFDKNADKTVSKLPGIRSYRFLDCKAQS